MTEAEPIVFIVDDDLSLRSSTEHRRPDGQVRPPGIRAHRVREHGERESL